MSARPLRVVLVKPSKYAHDGRVERFRRGFMPNSTLYHLASLTPASVAGRTVRVETVDEYVETDLNYLRLLRADEEHDTVLGLVGVQSHQLHRALDLAAHALANGVRHVVLGGPHPMTADTSAFHGRGVSIALAEAELIWGPILEDAARGELRPTYGEGRRFADALPGTVIVPPSQERLRHYAVQMLGVYPARGCPYRCTFCSVIKVAGRRIRSDPVSTTLATLRAAKAAGVLLVMFTSDNFNKYPEATELLKAMIAERLDLPFFVQCDVQVVRQPRFVELLARAGCYQMFVGVESFDRAALLAVKKNQNHPARYAELVSLCAEHGIGSHFSNILGFPTETAATIRERVDVLRALGPDLASFYVLTPFPGTEHYDELMAAGLVTEPNLDRFDATCPTWRHPHLGDAELSALLSEAYRRFYAWPDTAAKSLRWAWRKRRSGNLLLKIAVAAYSVLSRYAVARGMHPMAGGMGRVGLDGIVNYAKLRRTTYDLDVAPLPRSLQAPTGALPLTAVGR